MEKGACLTHVLPLRPYKWIPFPIVIAARSSGNNITAILNLVITITTYAHNKIETRDFQRVRRG